MKRSISASAAWLVVLSLSACAPDAALNGDDPEGTGTEQASEGDAVRGVLREGFEARGIASTWREGTTHRGLRVQFNGYGSVGLARDDSRVLRLLPRASTRDDETHAALVTSTLRFTNLDFTTRMRTVRPLRGDDANPWEAGWVLWHYTGNTRFYYFVLKPNGWELGKADPSYPGAQRFLATGSTPYFDPSEWHSVHVRTDGAQVSIEVDGTSVVEFTDEERPYRSGSVGLYTEDAEVYFDDLLAFDAS